MPQAANIRLLQVEPELGYFLSPDERVEARELLVPTHVIPPGPLDCCELLERMNAFGGLVLEGMMLQRLRVGDQVGLQILGPGDFISVTKQQRSMLLTEHDCKVVAETRLALLGRELLAAARHWPALLAGLHVRVAEQSDRLAAQLVICQLPRVEDRLLAIMWLLAESWGQVTRAGTSLPLSLTHDLLGGLVGARRSTVTLALGELADRGAMIRQDRGWLLLEEPPSSSGKLPEIEPPRLIEAVANGWGREEEPKVGSEDRVQLFDAVQRLREQHLINQLRHQQRLRNPPAPS